MTQYEQARFNSKANNKKFEENFDRIFRKKNKDNKVEKKK